MPTRKSAGVHRVLRLVRAGDVPAGAPAASGALQHTSWRGVSFFLHQGTTKTGKPKYYVAKKVGAGALTAMPAGFEFTESINGVVSVRRVDTSPKLVSDADVAAVQEAVARHHHLRHYRVKAGKDEMVIYEPVGALSEADRARLARVLGRPTGDLHANARYEPVMRFLAWQQGGPGNYAVQRMTYRGKGGWSHELARGPLAALPGQYVPPIGTEGFFELM